MHKNVQNEKERLKKKKGGTQKKKYIEMFAFHLFNTVTNHTAVATILFKTDIK